MPDHRCLNCDTAIVESARFCTRCGQRTDTARLSFADIVRDLMHSVPNVERSPLAFAWALLTRPGATAREYVEGKRRRHYGPFATLAVLVGVPALVINTSRIQILASEFSPSPAIDLLQRHFDLLLLVQLPLLGCICLVLFRGARLNLPEHMVLVAYTLSVRALVVALIVPLGYLMSIAPSSPIAIGGYWVAWYVYFGWAASQFHAGPRMSSWTRGALAAAIGHAAISAAITGASTAYLAFLAR